MSRFYKLLNGVDIYGYDNFPVTWLQRVPKAQKQHRSYDVGHHKDDIRYLNIITAFDIETTRIPDIEQSVLYIWQWHFDGIGCCIGRTWQEFQLFVDRLKEVMPAHTMLCVMDHNLSYEFQFLAGIYNFREDEVFCIDNRKILYCDMYDILHFRCSMMHSNSGLDLYLKDQGVQHKKLTLDYNKFRYPWTDLDDNELAYCINDVVGLVEATKNDMKFNKDDLYTFPLTSTGNVRRIFKKDMRAARKYFVQPVLPDLHIHTLLREGFRGGNVHGNRLCTGLTIDNVYSCDMSSCYPYEIMCGRVPVGKFRKIVENTVEAVENYIKHDMAVIMRVEFRKIKTKKHWEPVPYIPKDKCFRCDEDSFVNDNGRMISCNYILTTITDVDFEIIKKMYQWEHMEILEAYAAPYGYIPNKIRDIVRDLYTKKTSLKHVEGMEQEYMLAKQLLNSCYGLMCQNPIRVMTLFRNGEYVDDDSKTFKELYAAYCRNAFTCYQWAVWICCNARRDLQAGIDLINKTKGAQFVYCDTDSVKYRGSVDFTKLNNDRVKRAKKAGAFAADPKGNVHYMGVFEDEGMYEHFKTLGAKKYIFNYPGEHIEITIAGVNKDKGGLELEKRGGYDAFKEDFMFKEAGGTESIYNDDNFGLYEIDGHQIYITRNVVIKESTYKLGYSEIYRRLIYSLDTITGREYFNENIRRLHTLDIYE